MLLRTNDILTPDIRVQSCRQVNFLKRPAFKNYDNVMRFERNLMTIEDLIIMKSTFSFVGQNIWSLFYFDWQQFNKFSVSNVVWHVWKTIRRWMWRKKYKCSPVFFATFFSLFWCHSHFSLNNVVVRTLPDGNLIRQIWQRFSSLARRVGGLIHQMPRILTSYFSSTSQQKAS